MSTEQGSSSQDDSSQIQVCSYARSLLQIECTETCYTLTFQKSRAKRHVSESDAPKTKRPKTTEAVRLNRIAAINDELKSLDERLMYKDKEREMASNVRQYRRCEELTKGMAELKEKKPELEAEKKLLNRKQMQAQWYNKKKSSASNSTPSTPLSQTSRSTTLSSRSTTPLPLSSRSTTPLPLSPMSHSDSTVYVGSSSDQEEFHSSFEWSFSPHHFLLPNCAEPTNIHTYCPQLPNRLTLSLLRCQTISIFGKASPGVTGTGEAG